MESTPSTLPLETLLSNVIFMKDGSLLLQSLEVAEKPSKISISLSYLSCGFLGTDIRKLRHDCDLNRISEKLQDIIQQLLEKDYDSSYPNCKKAADKFNELVVRIGKKKHPIQTEDYGSKIKITDVFLQQYKHTTARIVRRSSVDIDPNLLNPLIKYQFGKEEPIENLSKSDELSNYSSEESEKSEEFDESTTSAPIQNNEESRSHSPPFIQNNEESPPDSPTSSEQEESL